MAVTQVQTTQTAPRNTFGGAKYVTSWIDASGQRHDVPYIQSWYARVEAKKHLKEGVDTAIWMLNKHRQVYEFSSLEMEKTLETIKPAEGPRTNGRVFELLSNLAVSAQGLQRQARKGNVRSDDYDALREIVEQLDIELEYAPAGEGAAQ